MKNTMVWWLKKGQPISIVDAETEAIARSIIFNRTLWYHFGGDNNVLILFTVAWYSSDTADSRQTCYLLSHERHIKFVTYPMISIS